MEIFAQQKWLPFSQQPKAAPSITLASSTNNIVSFRVKVSGMSVRDKTVGETLYQKLSLPHSEVMKIEGSPQLPMVTKLVAIPECDDVSISITQSNELRLENFYILPAPRIERKNSPGGGQVSSEVFEENKQKYATNADFPGKFGEIIEVGYVRGQKVARVAIYPIQFNPASKSLHIFTDFNVNISFKNPSSQINKELGIFGNMMQHAALNYKVDGMNSVQERGGSKSSGRMQKTTTGSVNRVTDLSLLVGTSAMPVDYLIITHSSLFNSNSLTTLANHRSTFNGYDVAIVKVQDIYADPNYSVGYVGIRDFITDVYLNGNANHIGDGHLGFILLVGDAYCMMAQHQWCLQLILQVSAIGRREEIIITRV